MPDYCYVIYCRLLGLDQLANDQIAGSIQVLAEVVSRHTNPAQGLTAHSSVYGRFLVVPKKGARAVEIAEAIVTETAAKGVALTMGIAGGPLEITRDLHGSNLAGHPINNAARLA